jgi:hypothetical protein
MTAWVVQQANEMVPAVDEALGKPLDNQINAKADQWIAQVHSEYARHCKDVRYAYHQAVANVTQETALQPPDTHRVVETETARNSSAVRLRGENEKSGWAEPGHGDPVLLAGGRRGGIIYLCALFAAAAADIVAFYQVVLLIQTRLTSHESAVLVVGFTAMALALAHFVGTMLRDRKAGAKWMHPILLIMPALGWLALGAIAFWARLASNIGASTGYEPPGDSSAASSASGPHATLISAAIFAGLYVATGAVALIGGYLYHNPLVVAFRQAGSEHEKAAEAQAISARRLGLAEAEREFFTDELTAAERVRDEAILARHALAEELKQRARLEYAKRLRDSSATDAFFDEDARPYTYRAFPN